MESCGYKEASGRKRSLKNCYLPEDSENPVRWCFSCQKWIHEGCCGLQVAGQLSRAEEFNQDYLLINPISTREANPKFDFIGLVTTPIQRIPGKPNQAPVSLEKLQLACRCYYTEERMLLNMNLVDITQEVRFFRIWDKPEEERIKQMVTIALDHLKSQPWFICPSCNVQYI
jgi:hypothetical protein